MTPAFHGTDSVVLAIGIIGATVMPHVIYPHSALTAQRQAPDGPAERKRALRTLRVDTTLGLSLAQLINLSMLRVAAAVFHGAAGDFDGSLGSAQQGFERLVGGGAALAFAAARHQTTNFVGPNRVSARRHPPLGLPLPSRSTGRMTDNAYSGIDGY